MEGISEDYKKILENESKKGIQRTDKSDTYIVCQEFAFNIDEKEIIDKLFQTIDRFEK